MANWCITNLVIEGEKDELEGLFQIMEELQNSDISTFPNGYGSTWLGHLVKQLGESPGIVECGGDWMDLKLCDDTLCFTTDTKWEPCYDVIRLLKQKFLSFRIYYRAVEPCCCIFKKNDAKGKYFPENVYGEMGGNKLYALNEQEMLQKLRVEFGLPSHICTLDEAEDFYDFSEDYDYFAYGLFELEEK